MARVHDSMVKPPIEDLLGRVDSKFSLVTLAARRARQLNSYYSHLGDGLGTIVPPQVPSMGKPLSMAFEEIAADKIQSVPPAPPAEEAAEEAAPEAVASSDDATA